MNRANFSLEVFGDRIPVAELFGESNNENKLNKMKKALRQAISSELTERQRQMVEEYYYHGLTVTETAKRFGVSKSTVSRHLSRSRERLKKALRYGMYIMWTED